MAADLARLQEVSRGLALGGPVLPAVLSAEPRALAESLSAAGTEIWLDTGDREAAAADWGPEIRALTTNNTLVNQVIQKGVLDGPLREAARVLRDQVPGVDDDTLVVELGFIANARVALDLVRMLGAFVSVELHPAFAHNTDASVWWGKRYFTLCPERFIVKVPLTPEGFVAVRRLSAQGVPVNYTLGFSARQNVLAALFSRPAYVNVFLGRLNAVVKDNGMGTGENVGERACLASDRWMKRLRAETGGPQSRQIAASIRDGRQVSALAGVDVHTIPPKAFHEFLQLGVAPAAVHGYGSADLEVDASLELSVLWDVPPAFEAFARAAGSEGDGVATADGLVSLARSCQVADLFHAWTADELSEIRSDGKIPVVAKWTGTVALDDLMTQAALQSFAVDQGHLDDRLRSLLGP